MERNFNICMWYVKYRLNILKEEIIIISIKIKIFNVKI